ncbi:MAG: phosphoribosylanthranilate isomerase [Candidatus Sumerlaeaceae bacterium]|nr:phosphoribosylanthranilate isomerase [Candidatus Sumerlaeaceae bacterium]
MLQANKQKVVPRMGIAIKICGITNELDLRVICEEGADYFGIVFYEKSPRYVSAPLARHLVKAATGSRTKAVGVTVNSTAEEILRLRDETEITHFQLHGHEPPDLVARLREHGFVVIKAVRIAEGVTRPQWTDYQPDLFLCDTLVSHALGGTGQAWDIGWLPGHFPIEKSFIAGGLTPDNVAQILRAVAPPFGVDVSSGVEFVPGKKDHSKLRAFISQVREHFN